MRRPIKIVLVSLLLFLINTIAVVAQKEEAYQHIKSLKQSALIVVLKTGSNKIASLEKSKQTKKADDLKAQYKKEQLEIVAAFYQYFSFCPVYFIYNTDLRQAKSGNFEGILLNDSLQPDLSIQYSGAAYYFCSLGNIYFDTYDTTMEGIAIFDSSYTMLKDPFPYYLRKHYSLAFIHRTNEDLVKTFHEKIAEFD
ncbi:MAG: hypothetical protein JKY42_02135 [Flavobacteriales bacterium]|nr:hypothetical protein [Flavobacteriales bacterium]